MTARKRTVLLLLLAIVTVNGMAIDIYTPSLPAVVTAFHTTIALVKNTITAFLVGSLIGSFFAGSLSDSFGRRSVILPSLGFFTLCCVLNSFAPSINLFDALRFLQGGFLAIAVVGIRALMAEYYEAHTLKKVSAYMVIAWSLGPIVAPVIGGYLQHYIGWQGPFYFLALYTLFLTALCLAYLPETLESKAHFSAKSLILNYVYVMRKSRVLVYASCNGASYAIIILFSVIAPFLIQDVLGYSPISFGHIALLVGLACLLGGITNRNLIARFSTDAIIVFGNSVTVLASASLLISTHWTPISLAWLMSVTFVNVFCVGLSYPLFTSRGIRAYPEMSGVTNSICIVATFLCTALASFAASLVHARSVAPLAALYLLCGLSLWIFQWLSAREKSGATTH